MISKFFYWLPRVLTILSLLFMLMFSFDSFSGNETVGRKILGIDLQISQKLVFPVLRLISAIPPGYRIHQQHYADPNYIYTI